MGGFTTFEGYVLARSPKAVLFQGHYWGSGLWFPVSQIQVIEDGPMSVVMRVKDWLAGKRDIREFETYNEEEIRERAGE